MKGHPNHGLEACVLIEFPSIRILLTAVFTAAVGMVTTVTATGHALVISLTN